MGSFFLVFMYLCSTDVKTKFTKDAAIQTIILAGSYLGAMLLAGVKLTQIRASPVNPAIAFGIIVWNAAGGDNWKNIYIFCLVSFLGSFLALIFFRLVYKKTTETMEDDDEEDERNEDEL